MVKQEKKNNAKRGQGKAVIDFLALYGFSVSEKEQRLIDGTHELYRKQV